MLLSLITVQYSASTNNDEKASSFPIGFITGSGITGGNMATAANANKKLLTELYTCYVNRITIKEGKTVYGLIGIKDVDYGIITLKMSHEK